jgi:hypothetical protein
MVLLGFQQILLQEQLVLKVQQALPDHKDLREQLDPLEQLVVKGLKVLKDLLAILVHKDQQERKELLDQSDLQGRLVQMEKMETGTQQHQQIHYPSQLVQKI